MQKLFKIFKKDNRKSYSLFEGTIDAILENDFTKVQDTKHAAQSVRKKNQSVLRKKNTVPFIAEKFITYFQTQSKDN